MLKALKLLISPAALCAWAICACVAFSVAGSYASRTITLKQETKFGWAQAAFPIHMKRWDETLFANLTAQRSAEMADFLKTAEQDAAAETGSRGGWEARNPIPSRRGLPSSSERFASSAILRSSSSAQGGS